MTFTSWADWRSNNQRIDVVPAGTLCGVQRGLGDLDVVGFNPVLDQHHQTWGQLDVRLAGKYDSTEPEDKLLVYVIAYEDDGAVATNDYLGQYYVRNVMYSEADDTTVLRMFTAESFVVDHQFSIDDAWTGTTVTLESWIRRLLDDALPMAYSLSGTALISGKNVLADQQRGLIGNSFMTHIDNLLRPLNLRLAAHPTGALVISDRAAAGPYSLPASALEDGPGKLLQDAVVETDRERTYNAVTLRYWWDNGTTSQTIDAFARVWGSSSDNSPERAGFKIYTEEISGGTSQAEANEAAKKTLQALLRREELLKMKLVLCPWVKPGDRLTWDGHDWEISKVQHDIVSDVTNIQAESLAPPPAVVNYTPTL